MATLLKRDVEELLEARQWAALRERLAAESPPDLGDLLLDLGKADRAVVFRVLSRPVATEVFASLRPEHKDALLRDLTDDESRHLLASLSPDDRTQLFEDLPGRVTQRLLNLLSPEDLREARVLLGYPEESVGRLMTPDYVAIRRAWSVTRALEHVRAKGRDSETIDVVYVTDDAWRLEGVVTLRHLILADPDDLVERLMTAPALALSPLDDRERAVRTMQRHGFYAIPVIDAERVLLGIVTIDDVLDVAQEEATEDFHKAAAVAPLATSYREAPAWALYRRRVGWLLGLVAANLVSSGVVAAYEETLAATVALAFFIPLLIDSGGNVGTQSATMMIRALATGDVTADRWRRTVLKELVIGAGLGLSMGLAASGLGLLRGGPAVGLVVGLSMASIVLVANLIGTLLPFVLTRLGLDPAVASSPLITTVADTAGLLIYFTMATWLLGAVGPAAAGPAVLATAAVEYAP